MTARRVAFGLLAVLVLLLVAAGWLAFRAYQAGTALLSAKDVVLELRGDVGGGDTDQLEARLPEVQADLATARAATARPRLARGGAPAVGSGPTSRPSASCRGPSTTSCATRCRRSSRIDAVLHAQEARGTDGRIDLAPLVAAAPDIVAAAASAHTAQAAVAAIDTDALVARLVGPVDQLQDGLDQVTGALDAGAQVAHAPAADARRRRARAPTCWSR